MSKQEIDPAEIRRRVMAYRIHNGDHVEVTATTPHIALKTTFIGAATIHLLSEGGQHLTPLTVHRANVMSKLMICFDAACEKAIAEVCEADGIFNPFDVALAVEAAAGVRAASLIAFVLKTDAWTDTHTHMLMENQKRALDLIALLATGNHATMNTEIARVAPDDGSPVEEQQRLLIQSLGKGGSA